MEGRDILVSEERDEWVSGWERTYEREEDYY